MIVVDASVIVGALVDEGASGRRARDAMGSDLEWCAPEHWKVEVVSAVRGLLLGGRLSEPKATRAVTRINALGVASENLDPLVPAIWRLRHSATAYDAAYVALADLRGIRLVTADVRLARAAAKYCRVELIGGRAPRG